MVEKYPLSSRKLCVSRYYGTMLYNLVIFLVLYLLLAHKSWNDPPKVSYSSFQQSAGKKSQLTKRPDYTVEQLSRGSTPKVCYITISIVPHRPDGKVT